jgi:hypothetical protein|tara:strand:+ start:65 stop:430 length:366 start_codon:yes stop_codon:yes gene_type:complete
MNKIFCVSCGFKILYEVTKPKFCCNCGQGAGSISSAAKKEGIEVETDFDINLSELKKGIVIESDKSKTSVEDIWGSVTSSEATTPRGSFGRAESKDPSGKELLDKTVKDCSSSRMKDIDGL